MHSETLGPVDTAFYFVESPQTPMNIGALSIFEGKIDFDGLLKLIDARLHQAPLYQQRVIQPPLYVGQPFWACDPDFYLGNHVFKKTLDAPGSDEQLRRLAGHLVSGALDRSKPLWELYVIDGLAGDRSAVFLKVHHCMVDGLSAVELFTLLLDMVPSTSSVSKKVLYDPPLPSMDTRQLIAEGLRREVAHKVGIMQKLGHDLSYIGSVLTDKEKRRKTLVGLANLVNDNLKPIGRLPINGTNTGKITLAWAEFSLAEIRAIRTSRAASVNEVMLTILGCAVERYVRQHSEHLDQNFLRVLVPVNMRAQEEKRDFGNRISVLPIDIPFGLTDPLERLGAVAEHSRVMKQSSLSNGLDMLLTLPALAPSMSQPLVWQIAPAAFSLLAHTWCTNVAAPEIPLFLLGHPLLHCYGFFPLNPSMGLATVVCSYNQRISLTLIADAGIIPDVTELREYVEDAFLALRKAAKVEPIVPAESVVPALPPMEVVAAPTAVQPPCDQEMKSPVETVPTVKVEPIATVEPAIPIDLLAISKVAEMAVLSNLEQKKKPTQPIEAANDGKPPLAAEFILASEARVEVHPITEAVSPSNGDCPPATESVVQAQPESKKLFSEAWAQAYRQAINSSIAYRNASTRWEAGSLAFVMRASPRHGYPQRSAVILDLHKGKCLAARSLPPEEAFSEAAFVIEGEYDDWMKVLCGKAQPLMMLMLGKLHLRKGSMAKLVPFTQSAQELVRSAQGIS